MASSKNSTSQRTQRKTSSGERDAISFLTNQHREVEELFKQFEKTEGAQERSRIVEEACAALTVHTELEEQVFYPAVRQALEEGDLLDEAQVEHGVAKELIEKLKGMRSMSWVSLMPARCVASSSCSSSFRLLSPPRKR
jgi:hemerythrin superfamily protein